MPRYITIPPRAEREPPLPGQVPYAVGDFVEVAGRLGNEIVLYVVEIISLWTTPYVGFTGQYYYKPRDLGEKIMAQFPSSVNPNEITSPEAAEALKCEDNEIFQSTYSGDNHVAAIVRKCNVVTASQFHHQLVHNPDDVSTYLCRYAFHAWKFPSPFSKLETEEDRVSVRVGDDCQAVVPPFVEPMTTVKEEKTAASPTKELAIRRWQSSKNEEGDAVETFLQVVKCLQIAVGNIVYAWHEKAREQILSVLEEHKGNHSFRVVYLDGSGSIVVDASFVRGLVSQDEALMLLHEADYNYRIATEQVTRLISTRSAAAVKFARDTHSDDGNASDSSVASTSSSSPRTFKRQCKQQAQSSGKATRKN
ncbi:unnamed protein product [Aphanomyces euteiches]|uniref:BAH domain-containing protein n=1 Tax=Aphanomyces euteiches TaxID=100861 RepID=A0A6G0XTG8_9STRA|nr:hypothetical protein Ae201684_001391 [Aphanomyces euteiches]KAH9075494.1 hypothetical protein Ae201684P_004173 [Aphanomyces euteiches]KAH9141264.1 hypothetical protein AeRB84_014465 [Aphanomyces euteiches]KAH9142298.1 hypothetical protein AeRB84_013567 [Aphanomyces euteiches]KAH9146537.1 hypothetical protein AeRB84_009642 [Aphanomyces euteiches]